MPKKTFKEPKSRLAPKTRKHHSTVAIPEDVWRAVQIATIQDGLRLGRRVGTNEFIVRAIIDRIGKVYGTRFAKRLYRQYFNGIVPLKSDPEQFPRLQTVQIDRLGEEDDTEEAAEES